MEIIRTGMVENVRKPRVFVCQKCGCKFRADNTEYKEASQIELFYDGITRKCKCPCCGNMAYQHKGE